jgi:hypothetical protein
MKPCHMEHSLFYFELQKCKNSKVILLHAMRE